MALADVAAGINNSIQEQLAAKLKLQQQAADQARQDRDFALKEQEAAQRAKIGDATLAQMTDERATNLGTKQLAPYGPGDVLPPEAAAAGRAGGFGGNIQRQSPVLPSQSLTGMSTGTPGGDMPVFGLMTRTQNPAHGTQDVYLGTDKQREEAQQKAFLGRLITRLPAGSRERMAIEYEQGTGKNAPAGVFDPKPSTSSDGNFTLNGQPIVGIKQNGRIVYQGQDVTDQVRPYVPPPSPAGETSRLDRSYSESAKTLDSLRKPVEDKSAKLSDLTDILNQNTPQADALVAPKLLTVMAGGAGSGLRMNEAEIARIVGGRSAWQNLQAAAQHWNADPGSANSITPEQRRQIRALTTAVQGKVSAKMTALEKASQDLIDAPDVSTHRRVVSGVRQQLDTIDHAGGGAAAPAAGGASAGTAPPAPAGWKYVPKPGGGWTAVEETR